MTALPLQAPVATCLALVADIFLAVAHIDWKLMSGQSASHPLQSLDAGRNKMCDVIKSGRASTAAVAITTYTLIASSCVRVHSLTARCHHHITTAHVSLSPVFTEIIFHALQCTVYMHKQTLCCVLETRISKDYNIGSG